MRHVPVGFKGCLCDKAGRQTSDALFGIPVYDQGATQARLGTDNKSTIVEKKNHRRGKMPLLPASRAGSFQEQCSLELEGCAALESQSPLSGKVRWQEAKRRMVQPGQPRIVLADLDLSRADLTGFDLSRCYFARVKFCHAQLNRTNFRQAIFRNTDFTGALLLDADLSAVDLRSCNLNFATPVSDIRGVRPWLAEKIESAQYRSDHSVNTRSVFLRGWYAVTEHGSSLKSLGAISLLTIVAFGLIYYAIQSVSGEKLFWDQMSLVTALEFSALIFMNSGPGLLTSNSWVLAAMTTEVAIGIVVLAVFIASVTRQLTVR